jgi:hypothetical protein
MTSADTGTLYYPENDWSCMKVLIAENLSNPCRKLKKNIVPEKAQFR